MGRKGIIGVLLGFILVGGAGAKEVQPTPDLEFLEFLGTFGGPGNKDLDPVDLADLPNEGENQGKSPCKNSAEEKEKREGKG